MPQESTLLSISQLALTLTGFAALVSVFRTGQQKWTQAEIIGQYIILELSLSATFFAVLPIGLFYTAGSEHHIWRISSGISFIFAVGWLSMMFARVYKTYRHARQFPLNPIIAIFLTVFSLPILAAMIVNILWLDTFYIYLWHILWTMLIGGSQFIVFIYGYARQELITNGEPPAGTPTP